MATRLTLNIDEKVIKKAKLAAKKRKVSVSKLFADYITALEAKGTTKKKQPIFPLAEWLAGDDAFETTKKTTLIIC